jgi:hypothetical protein
VCTATANRTRSDNNEFVAKLAHSCLCDPRPLHASICAFCVYSHAQTWLVLESRAHAVGGKRNRANPCTTVALLRLQTCFLVMPLPCAHNCKSDAGCCAVILSALRIEFSCVCAAYCTAVSAAASRQCVTSASCGVGVGRPADAVGKYVYPVKRPNGCRSDVVRTLVFVLGCFCVFCVTPPVLRRSALVYGVASCN